ncbi:MAG: TPR end-of-group domain-containing protein [Syntrophales bacterium]
MSYINDALRKAQRERDGRYERFGGIITSGPKRPGQPRKRRVAVGVAVLLVLIPAVLLLAVYVLQQPSPVKKGTAPRLAAVNSAASQSATLPAAREAVPAGTLPKGPPAETAVVRVDGNPLRGEAELRYQEAFSAQRKGDVSKAEALYQRVLTLDPGDVRALNNLGVILMGQRKRERAIALFSKAIVLKKDYVDPYYNLACLYAQTNEIDESIWYLKVAMTINGEAKNWAEKDADMKNVVASAAFKKIREGQKN